MADKENKINTITQKKKRTWITQKSYPRLSLKESIKLATAILENYAGKPTRPHNLAIAVGIASWSSNFKYLCGASSAYGLTEGSYNSEFISMTELGNKLLSPTIEGDDVKAKLEAALNPTIFNKFLNKYHLHKFPKDDIVKNVLISEFGLPTEHADKTLSIIKENCDFVGIFKKDKTGLIVDIEEPQQLQHIKSPEDIEEETLETIDDDLQKEEKSSFDQESKKTTEIVKANNRVFISHGKDFTIIEQIKKIVKYGKFEPVISVEKESTAIPVPDKVFDDMRSCSAGIIHVKKEGNLCDNKGNEVQRLNENVLIEIGAAIALYKRNFILLCEKEIKLPSNLQGLYKCEYEGDKLDSDATMKLLETFNEFKFD